MRRQSGDVSALPVGGNDRRDVAPPVGGRVKCPPLPEVFVFSGEEGINGPLIHEMYSFLIISILSHCISRLIKGTKTEHA